MVPVPGNLNFRQEGDRHQQPSHQETDRPLGAHTYRLAVRLLTLASDSSPCLLHSVSRKFVQSQLQGKMMRGQLGSQQGVWRDKVLKGEDSPERKEWGSGFAATQGYCFLPCQGEQTKRQCPLRLLWPSQQAKSLEHLPEEQG